MHLWMYVCSPSIYHVKFNLIDSIMETTLPYHFKRQSDNFFDWLLNTIKSEKYHEADSQIVNYSEAS